MQKLAMSHVSKGMKNTPAHKNTYRFNHSIINNFLYFDIKASI